MSFLVGDSGGEVSRRGLFGMRVLHLVGSTGGWMFCGIALSVGLSLPLSEVKS